VKTEMAGISIYQDHRKQFREVRALDLVAVLEDKWDKVSSEAQAIILFFIAEGMKFTT
jgi:hypothetical protein